MVSKPWSKASTEYIYNWNEFGYDEGSFHVFWVHIKKMASAQQALALFKLRQTSHESSYKHLGLSNQENLYLLIFIKCNFQSYKNRCHEWCIL